MAMFIPFEYNPTGNCWSAGSSPRWGMPAATAWPGSIPTAAWIPALNDIAVTLALQPDGKILVGGEFWSVNGTPRNRIARLNDDGSLDPTFNPGAGPDYGVTAIAVQSDGRCIVGGLFTSFNGASRM